ncbi:hypothetical protein GOV10_05740 [Candidatus Woesearchaeota archaeon]|nr:hypothetical protein [Candidatus Woesearchaeota archaeon]
MAKWKAKGIGLFVSTAFLLSPEYIAEEEIPVPSIFENHAKQQRNVDYIVTDFSPILAGEYYRGELDIILKESVFGLESAKYSPADKSISIFCKEGMEECPLSSIPHELGHHIDYITNNELKRVAYSFDTFGQLMEMRRLRTDSHAFNTAQKKLIPLQKQLSVLNRLQEAKEACFFVNDIVNNTNRILALAEKYSVSDEFIFAMKESQKYLDGATQLCQEEDLANKLDDSLKELREKYWPIYSEMKIDTEVNQQDIFYEEYRADNFFYALKKHSFFTKIITSRMLLDMRDAPEEDKSEVELYSEVNYLLTKLYIPKKDNPLPHDAMISEQFAAAVASLYYGHVGPWRWPPLAFTLTPDMLNYFEQYEYQGERILAPHVEKYRRAPGLEEYWMSIGIGVRQ